MIELLTAAALIASGEQITLPRVTITARIETPTEEVAAAASILIPEAGLRAYRHPAELLDGAAGVWISRGSGAEHLTAIRSPVLTGAGACGAFAFQEDGIAIRPPGFCNVNQLFEVNLAQATRVEVLRGPGAAIHGSNALHGVINSVSPTPQTAENGVSLLLGEDAHREVRVSYASESWAIVGRGLSSGSFRDDAGHDQQFVNVHWAPSPSWSTRLAFANLNQETAGFIRGEGAYRDPASRRSNPNPEAYRDAHALRLAARHRRDIGNWTWQIEPFARVSDMVFIQHFLPGQPLEENDQRSIGIYSSAERPTRFGSASVGLEVDLGKGSLRQFQDGPTTGSPFLVATRPPGKHYDYEVDMATLAVFAGMTWQLGDALQFHGALRLESNAYDYDNRLAAGNLRDDGTACGFGGCIYSRPEDRHDRFTALAPKATLRWQAADHVSTYLRASRGFRAPQATELYRLQAGQTIADLDAEVLDQWELGARGSLSRGSWSASAFYAIKRDSILRDRDGFNVSGARTRHRGIEAELNLALHASVRLDASATFAAHSYGAFPDASEPIVAGNEVDTAPSSVANVRLTFPLFGGRGAIGWRHLGSYYLDAANAHAYPGHDLLDLGFDYDLDARWRLGVALRNAGNRRYAERADFAFGSHRYLPGEGRSVMFTLHWRQAKTRS